MVDQVLQDKAEASAVASTDLLHIVNDPSGTPVDKKLTAANLFSKPLPFGDVTPSTGDFTTLEAASLSFDSGTNTLDAYSEGTFTPVLTGSTIAGANSYTTQTGNYTVIGNRCFYDIEMRLDGTSGALDSTGNLVITGLPFVKAGGTFTGVYFGFIDGLNLGSDNIMGNISGSQVTLKDSASGGVQDFSNADATDSLRLNISGTYQI